MVKSDNITLTVNRNAVKAVVCGIISLGCLAYLAVTQSFLPFGGVVYGVAYLIADILCPVAAIVFGGCAVMALFRLSKKSIVIISVAVSVAVAVKYAYVFLASMGGSLFGIADGTTTVLVVAAFHLFYAAAICLVSCFALMTFAKRC